jgi:hypothetical protein
VTSDASDVSTVVELERRLLRPEIRSDRHRVEALLHRDFLEFGASGRVWDRETIVEALEADPTGPGAAEEFTSVRLAEHVVLLTYRVSGRAGSLRSSLWVRDGAAGWQLRFHQGTHLPSWGRESGTPGPPPGPPAS